MATQQSLNQALTVLSTALKSATCTDSTRVYWTGLLAKPYTLHHDGSIQSTISNPLAYFMVPLSGTGKSGRNHDFVLQQFSFALSQGWTCKAHVALRGVNEAAIVAGMSFAMPRQDSSLGTVLGRKAATIAAKNAPTMEAATLAVTINDAVKAHDMEKVLDAGQRLDQLLVEFAAEKEAESAKAAKAAKAAESKAAKAAKAAEKEATKGEGPAVKPARKSRAKKQA